MFAMILGDSYRRAPKGLTLTEVLITITLVAMLMGMSFSVLARSRREARITQCKNNMTQIFKAIQMFDNDCDRFAENYPARITFLNYFKGTRQREYMLAPMMDDSGEVYEGPKYLSSDRIFICPLDDSFGKEGGKPEYAKNQYHETDEGPKRGTPQLFDNSPWSSYLYEFSEAECDWWEEYVDAYVGGWWEGPPFGPADIDRDDDYEDHEIIDTNWDGKVSWQETKFYQQRYGDTWLHLSWEDGYPQSWFPVVRCFWHQKNVEIEAYQTDILNLTMTGSLFTSGPLWERIAVMNLDPEFDNEDVIDELGWDADD